MIKNIIVGISIFLLQMGVLAQSYKPLLDDYNEWHFTTCYSGCPTDVYYTVDDTLVNGIPHKILYGYHYISRTFLLSEDTLAKTVSLTTTSNKIETYLLYDFSLNVGDSIDIQNPISPFPDTPGYFRVDSIQMKMLDDGNDYKHFYLSVINPTPGASNAVWIEGVGSLSLINAPGGLNDINGTGHLSCFFKNGIGHYSNLDSIAGCDAIYTPTSVKENNSIVIDLYPNPTTSDFYISSSESLRYVQIHNLSGQIVSTQHLNTAYNSSFNIEALTEGVYFISIYLDSGVKVVKRIVRE